MSKANPSLALSIIWSEMGRLQERQDKLKPMQYEQTGVGGKVEDEGVTGMINAMEQKINDLDEIADLIQTTYDES